MNSGSKNTSSHMCNNDRASPPPPPVPPRKGKLIQAGPPPPSRNPVNVRPQMMQCYYLPAQQQTLYNNNSTEVQYVLETQASPMQQQFHPSHPSSMPLKPVSMHECETNLVLAKATSERVKFPEAQNATVPVASRVKQHTNTFKQQSQHNNLPSYGIPTAYSPAALLQHSSEPNHSPIPVISAGQQVNVSNGQTTYHLTPGAAPFNSVLNSSNPSGYQQLRSFDFVNQHDNKSYHMQNAMMQQRHMSNQSPASVISTTSTRSTNSDIPDKPPPPYPGPTYKSQPTSNHIFPHQQSASAYQPSLWSHTDSYAQHPVDNFVEESELASHYSEDTVTSSSKNFRRTSPKPDRNPEAQKKEEDGQYRLRTFSADAYKFYMEQHIENLTKSCENRKNRLCTLEKEMADIKLNGVQQNNVLDMLSSKENDYLRKTRAKLNISMFEFICILGVGAFGKVSLVKRAGTKSHYAMKTLKKADVVKRKQVAHVKAERDILAEADNEWVVKLYYSFQDKENLYLVMDYIPGGDMMGRLIKEGIFSEKLAQFYIAELVLAVESVHQMGFIHRDIKPDNILIDKSGHIKLTDFGLCTGFHWTHNSKFYQTGKFYCITSIFIYILKYFRE